MAFNKTAKQTNLIKYGNNCSLHGEKGLLNNPDILYRQQVGNRNTVRSAKDRLLNGLKLASIELLDDISNTYPLYHHLFHYRCLKCGHEFTHIQRYKIPVCKKCNPRTRRSNGEMEIIRYIQTFYKDKIELNNKSEIPPKELDIYLPDIKLGIEYNGVYWHNKNEQDDHQKLIMCESKGIRLIQIFDFEWVSFRDCFQKIIKNIIENKGIIFYNKDDHHDRRFPLHPMLKIVKTLPPQERLLKDYIKVYPSWESVTYKDSGSFLLENNGFDLLFPNLIFHQSITAD